MSVSFSIEDRCAVTVDHAPRSTSHRADETRLSGRRTDPLPRCRRHDYEGTSYSLGVPGVQRSLITQQHRPILDRLPAGQGLRQDNGSSDTDFVYVREISPLVLRVEGVASLASAPEGSPSALPVDVISPAVAERLLPSCFICSWAAANWLLRNSVCN